MPPAEIPRRNLKKIARYRFFSLNVMKRSQEAEQLNEIRFTVNLRPFVLINKFVINGPRTADRDVIALKRLDCP